MPRLQKGQLSLNEIRNLVRQHNKLTMIKGVDTKKRGDLIKELESHGYQIDHENKKLLRTSRKVGAVAAKVDEKGERKDQKKTIAKKKRKAFAEKEKPKVNPKTGKPKMKPPPVAAAVAKQKAAKLKKAAERKKLMGGD
jgi:hypothetical protein